MPNGAVMFEIAAAFAPAALLAAIGAGFLLNDFFR